LNRNTGSGKYTYRVCGSLDRVVGCLDRVVGSLDRIVGSLDRIVGSLDRVVGSLDRIVGSPGGVVGSLDRVVRSLVRIKVTIDSLVDVPLRLLEACFEGTIWNSSNLESEIGQASSQDLDERNLGSAVSEGSCLESCRADEHLIGKWKLHLLWSRS
jgi:hypothetical protein